jgi:biopolymer transport protein ExbB
VDVNIVEKLLGLALVGSAWVLWLLIALSVLSVAVMIERAIFFARTRVDFRVFCGDLTKHLITKDLEAVRRLCEQHAAVESQVVMQALEHQSKGVIAMRESMDGYLAGVRQELDRGLVILGTLGNNAPFIGLFGTVVGIIQAFHQLNINPAGGPAVVMGGISEALVATAVGILVAIPAVIANNLFQRAIKRRMANAEAVKSLILTYHEQ